MGHANLRYMLQRMGRVKSPLCRKCDAEKETSVHIPSKRLALERGSKTLGWVGMEPDQIKKSEEEWRRGPYERDRNTERSAEINVGK